MDKDKEAEIIISLSLSTTMEGLRSEINRQFPDASFRGRIDGQRIDVVLVSKEDPELNKFCTDIEDNVAYPEISFSIKRLE